MHTRILSPKELGLGYSSGKDGDESKSRRKGGKGIEFEGGRDNWMDGEVWMEGGFERLRNGRKLRNLFQRTRKACFCMSYRSS